MKHFTTNLFLLVCLLASNITISQTTLPRKSVGNAQTSSSMSIIEKYGREYEVINYQFNGDSTILDVINPLTLDHFRHATDDVVLNYKNTSLQILIYSMSRIESAQLKERDELLIQID